MSKGLELFLKRIKQNPSHQQFIDRFLHLLADETPVVRMEYCLKLANYLVQVRPLQALEITYLALKDVRAGHLQADHEIEILTVVSLCFQALNRPGKVTVVQNEIRKLKSQRQKAEAEKSSHRRKKQAAPAANQGFTLDKTKTRTRPKTLTDTKISSLNAASQGHLDRRPDRKTPPVPGPEFPDSEDTRTRAVKAAEEGSAVRPKSPMPEPSHDQEPRSFSGRDFTRTQTIIDLDEGTGELDERPSTQTPRKPEAPPTAASQDLVRESKNLLARLGFRGKPAPASAPPKVPSSAAEAAPVLNDTGGQQPVPKKDLVTGSTKVEDLELLLQQFADTVSGFYGQGSSVLKQELEQLGRHLNPKLDQALVLGLHRELSRMIESGATDLSKQAHGFVYVFQNLGALRTIEMLAAWQMRLAEETAWFLYLDCLIVLGRGRKAYANIIKMLQDQSSLKLASGAYDRLLRIWQDLGLQPIDWKPGEGVAALVEALRHKPLPASKTALLG